MIEQTSETPLGQTSPEVISVTPKKSPLPVVLLVILGLLIAAGSVYAGIAIGKKQTQPNIIAEPTVAPQATEVTPIFDETANWKTYKNSALGFEIKYPSSVEVEKEFNDQYNRSTRFKGGNLHFEVMLRKTGNIPFDKYYYMDTPIKNITTLDGNVAHVHELPNGYCDGGQSCSEPSISIVAVSGSDIYHIAFIGDAQLSDIENQILSTFKFTQPSTSDLRSQVENWTSYTQSPTKLSWDKCDGESTISSSLKGMMAVYPVFIKEINGLKLAYTSKLDFTAQDVAKFTLCEAGNFYPIYTFNDKILWTNACSTGIVPDNPKCEDTLTQIQKLYGYTK